MALGNFLTETYLSLRRLENKAIANYTGGQIQLGFEELTPIKVSIGQFYGIEINDFAVTVAKTALWIAEAQMYHETQEIVQMKEDFLPLKTYANIVEANALRIDWNDVVPANEINYIMGNPPFVGSSKTDNLNEQKTDMKLLWENETKGYGKLDYVSCWYLKASIFIQSSKIKCAFVSTNSICQGEQVTLLWRTLFEKYKINIDYAYHSFKWQSEAKEKANVICIIIGFSLTNNNMKQIYESNGNIIKAKHINGYLMDSEDFYIKSRSNSLYKNMPKIIQGNKPWDGGNLILDEEEALNLINNYPNCKKFVKRFYGGNELINNKRRYCLWLKDIEPSEYNKIPEIISRLKKVKECREKTKTKAVQEQANIPMLFSQIRQPNSNYIAIPEVSTSTRKYIPIAFLTKDDIASNKLFIIPNGSLLLFGILESNVHMGWMRIVAGRLGTGYSYSPSVYNNFPWPTPTEKQKEKIEQTAKAILDVRAKYPNSSLADLYDPLTMPQDLYKAHKNNDAAVMNAYGFDWHKMSEDDCVAELFKMYEKLVEENK